MKNCDICANDVFRSMWKETGVAHRAFTPPSFTHPDGSGGTPGDAQPALPAGMDTEALIQAITDRVIAELKKNCAARHCSSASARSRMYCRASCTSATAVPRTRPLRSHVASKSNSSKSSADANRRRARTPSVPW